MDKVAELLSLPSVDAKEVVHDLLVEIARLRGNNEQILELVKRQREQSEALVKDMNRVHQEEIQKHMAKHAEHLTHLEQINEICAGTTIMVDCRKCGCKYELPCDVSEYDPEMSYCGKGGPSPCLP